MKPLALGCTLAGLAVAGFGFLLVESSFAHRTRPHPDGLVFQVETGEVFTPLDRPTIRRSTADPGAIVVETKGAGRREGSRRVYRYPSGEPIPDPEGSLVRADALVSSPLDLDGDGTQDLIRIGERPDHHGIVQVVSGRNGKVLFEDRDELEYETNDRLYPLGDIDGDGCSEMALLHPRADRSAYDFELFDAVLGAKSWISILSGARVKREWPEAALLFTYPERK